MKALASAIAALASQDEADRAAGAAEIYRAGCALAEPILHEWRKDGEFARLVGGETPAITVGVAVDQVTFARIRAANGSPLLARVPPQQDAAEFELHFPSEVSMDIITTNQPGGPGAIARYLARFGEGIQQVEYRTKDVDRATRILCEKFGQQAAYPEPRPGANGTRVNFFLVASPEGSKVLIELYQTASP